MTWNYRIVRYANGSGYGLHEVHYDDMDHEVSMTSEPAGFVGDTVEEVVGALAGAEFDGRTRAVFDEPKNWSTLRLRDVLAGLVRAVDDAPLDHDADVCLAMVAAHAALGNDDGVEYWEDCLEGLAWDDEDEEVE